MKWETIAGKGVIKDSGVTVTHIGDDPELVCRAHGDRPLPMCDASVTITFGQVPKDRGAAICFGVTAIGPVEAIGLFDGKRAVSLAVFSGPRGDIHAWGEMREGNICSAVAVGDTLTAAWTALSRELFFVLKGERVGSAVVLPPGDFVFAVSCRDGAEIRITAAEGFAVVALTLQGVPCGSQSMRVTATNFSGDEVFTIEVDPTSTRFLSVKEAIVAQLSMSATLRLLLMDGRVLGEAEEHFLIQDLFGCVLTSTGTEEGRGDVVADSGNCDVGQ